MKAGDLLQWVILGAGGYLAWRLYNGASATATKVNAAIFENVTAPAADAIVSVTDSIARGIGYARERMTGVLDLERLRPFKSTSSGQSYSLTLADAYKVNTAPGRAKGFGSVSPQSAADAAAYAQFVGAAIGVPKDWSPK